MLSAELLKFVRCPEDGSELTVAGEGLVRQVNAAIRAGRLTTRAGRTLEEEIGGGLIRAKGDVLYPILHGIPVLLRDEAIVLEQLTGAERN
jgi:uncharacterized protein YbaR (Trm112 family)